MPGFDATAASLAAFDISLGGAAAAGGAEPAGAEVAGGGAAGAAAVGAEVAGGGVCAVLDGFRANNRTANTIRRTAMIAKAA